MTVLDRLERQLTASVEERGRAAAPAAAPSRPPWWRRRGGRTPLLAALAALLVAGGAVAATGGLPIGPEDLSQVEAAHRDPHRGAGVVRGPQDVLAVRAADPAGGPPWALRVFATSRGTSCVQVGQVYRGVFGAVSADGAGHVAFRPVRARPGDGSLCLTSRSHGFPVTRAQSTVALVGGSGDARRCGVRREPCPIRDVRVIRYGLLGQAARHATLVAPDGRPRTSMALSPRAGGAYLFVTPVPAAPFQRDEDRQRLRTAPRGTPYLERPGLTDAVVATFAGGIRRRVSGPHHSRAPLPGVGRARPPAAVATRAPLHVRASGRGAQRRFAVSFRAPVAVTRATHGYRLTVTGGTRPGCPTVAAHGFDATTRDIARGATVRLAVAPAGAGWCPGRHVIRVGFHRPGDPDGGRLVGTSAFRVR